MWRPALTSVIRKIGMPAVKKIMLDRRIESDPEKSVPAKITLEERDEIQ
jgi:hypothetical protein